MFTECDHVIQQGVKYQYAEQLLQQVKKKQLTLFKLHFKALQWPFEVTACQYLRATDRQQSCLCIIPPFHTFAVKQIGGEKKTEIQNKTC